MDILDISWIMDNMYLISTLSTSAIILSAAMKYSLTKARKQPQSDKIPIFENSVELNWKGTKPCFCREKIVLNINSTPPHTHIYYCETIAHIFGISDAKQMIIEDSESGALADTLSGDDWFVTMINGNKFSVNVKEEYYLTSKYRIKEISQIIGKYSSVKKLSLTFYNRVWNDEENEDFRQTFTQNSKSLEEAADNQSRWLWEMWGGKDDTYTSKHGNGTIFKRMLARHSKSQMSFENACLWLKHMKVATLETFGDDKDLIQSIFAYWLHFLAFFQYNSRERQTFQSVLFETK